MNTFLFENEIFPQGRASRKGCKCGNRISDANFLIVYHSHYESILLSFRDMTMEQTTDGRRIDRWQASHIWLWLAVKAGQQYQVCYAVERCLSVRPSVCLSLTRRYSIETAKHILKLSTLWGSHTIIFFGTRRYGNILTRTP